MISMMGGLRAQPVAWDLFSDTWAATDGLGRPLPMGQEVPLPRPDRTVGLFYFLWHGAHIRGGPYDITQILAANPQAMDQQGSPPWGPMGAMHHWGKPLFGYYLTDDDSVLRKHAQMLSDAGVDTVIFDVTNQITYREWYRALLRVWGEMRALGNRTPQVAFLTPFWSPEQVVRELWRDLYKPGLHEDLWFQWEGKPLLLANPELLVAREENAHQNIPVELKPGDLIGQSFTTALPLHAVGGRFATWFTTEGSVTLTLRVGSPAGKKVAEQRFPRVDDNSWLDLRFPRPLPPGSYLLQASGAAGRIGWWSHTEDKFPRGEAFANGKGTAGDRTLRIESLDEEISAIQEFFTFRSPQPDYFQGPLKPDMWSWLEVFPQHVFVNAKGEKEEMSVGVAQNAVDGRLGSMSEPGARGRSFHKGGMDTRPDAVRHGFNVAEQWRRALREDPRFLFVTGWNEWIAGRYQEFHHIRRPVMFVDQFDQEHSRDIEPMRGGHGDDYYYQLASFVRQYKGARPLPPAQPHPIVVDGKFDDWRVVQPEYRDTVGDPVHRNHRGWREQTFYRDETGRNDIVAAKCSWDANTLWFYVRTREALSAPEGTNWMLLFLNLDEDQSTGWLGYDFVLNRAATGGLEQHAGNGFTWKPAGRVKWRMAANELELAISWTQLGLENPPANWQFKWADNGIQAGDWSDFTLHGDAAPNDRFNYRVRLPEK